MARDGRETKGTNRVGEESIRKQKLAADRTHWLALVALVWEWKSQPIRHGIPKYVSVKATWLGFTFIKVDGLK